MRLHEVSYVNLVKKIATFTKIIFQTTLDFLQQLDIQCKCWKKMVKIIQSLGELELPYDPINQA